MEKIIVNNPVPVTKGIIVEINPLGEILLKSQGLQPLEAINILAKMIEHLTVEIAKAQAKRIAMPHLVGS